MYPRQLDKHRVCFPLLLPATGATTFTLNLPALSTSRLLLRPFLPEDALHLYQLHADPEVNRFTGEKPFATLSAAQSFIQGYTQYQQYGTGRLTVLDTCSGDYLGWCGLKTHDEQRFVELGFRIKRTHWGKGYATEAALACIEDGFSRLQLQKIIGRTLPGNKASVSVLEKCGFTFDGIISADQWPAMRFLLHREDWMLCLQKDK